MREKTYFPTYLGSRGCFEKITVEGEVIVGASNGANALAGIEVRQKGVRISFAKYQIQWKENDGTEPGHGTYNGKCTSKMTY